MKLFATRVWWFDPSIWPVVPFNISGNRTNLLRNSDPGDAVVFLGTKGDPTPDALRGRLLGVAQFGRKEVDTLDVVPKKNIPEELFDENGSIRWPKALVMTRAWRFKDPLPLVNEVLESRLPYAASSRAVELGDKDTEAVMNLAAEEFPVPETPTLLELRGQEAALTQGRPTTGVIPSAWETIVTRSLGNASVTYAFRFGTTNYWKIGHTANHDRRLKEVNAHVPTEFLKQKWEAYKIHTWDDELLARDMEQRLFDILSEDRTEGERVCCPQERLDSAWIKSILNHR